MEYLMNGDFREDLKDRENGWTVSGSVERVGDVGQYGHSNFAHFAGSGHLSQTAFMQASQPSRLQLSLGVQVQGGNDTPAGLVQVIVEVRYAVGLPDRRTYLIQEFGTWQTARIQLPVSAPPVSVSLNFAVLGSPEKVINLRQISLADDQIQGAVEEKKHDADHQIRGLIEKLTKKIEDLSKKVDRLIER